MANHEIKTMIEWSRQPAPTNPKLETVGSRAAEATAAERSPLVGLGAQVYPRSVEPTVSGVKPFSGDFGVYKTGPDHRVLQPRTELREVVTGRR